MELPIHLISSAFFQSTIDKGGTNIHSPRLIGGHKQIIDKDDDMEAEWATGSGKNMIQMSNVLIIKSGIEKKITIDAKVKNCENIESAIYIRIAPYLADIVDTSIFLNFWGNVTQIWFGRYHAFTFNGFQCCSIWVS